MRPVQIGLKHRRLAEIGIIGKRVLHQGSVKHRAWQLGRGEPRRLQPRLGQIGGAEVSPRHLRAVEHGAREIAIGHLRLGQVGQVEVGADGDYPVEDGAAKLGAVEGGVGQDGTGQVHAGQIGLLEIRAMQVAAPAFRARTGNQVLERTGARASRSQHHCGKNQNGSVHAISFRLLPAGGQGR